MESIRVIRKEVEDAIQKAYLDVRNKSEENYYLLLARADCTKVFGDDVNRLYLNYNVDEINDDTRIHFFERYMNRYYHSEEFCYDGEDGLDCLTIEMLVFSHIWESYYFLKSLSRLSITMLQGVYPWEIKEEDFSSFKFWKNKIIKPLQKTNYHLGNVIEKAYNSNIRNALAHSQFQVCPESRTIHLSNHSIKNDNQRDISFDDFQLKFLYAAALSYYIYTVQEDLRNQFAKDNNGRIFDIKLPNSDGVCKMTVKSNPDRPYVFLCVD